MLNYCMRPGGDNELADIINLLPENAVIAEIGSFAGESAEIFSKSSKINKIYCIDPWINNYDINDRTSNYDMSLIEKEFDNRHKNNSKVIKIKDKSEVAINLFEDNSLDMVYIDGDHRYDAVVKDILLWKFKVKIGGILAGHDYNVDPNNFVYLAIRDTIKTVDYFFEKYGSWAKIIKE